MVYDICKIFIQELVCMKVYRSRQNRFFSSGNEAHVLYCLWLKQILERVLSCMSCQWYRRLSTSVHQSVSHLDPPSLCGWGIQCVHLNSNNNNDKFTQRATTSDAAQRSGHRNVPTQRLDLNVKDCQRC